MIMEITERYESWEIYPALLPYTSCWTLGKQLLFQSVSSTVGWRGSCQYKVQKELGFRMRQTWVSILALSLSSSGC